MFDGVDLLCAPLLTLQEALDHPQTRHNGTLVDVEIEGVRTTRLMGNPVTLSRTPAQVHRGCRRSVNMPTKSSMSSVSPSPMSRPCAIRE